MFVYKRVDTNIAFDTAMLIIDIGMYGSQLFYVSRGTIQVMLATEARKAEADYIKASWA